MIGFYGRISYGYLPRDRPEPRGPDRLRSPVILKPSICWASGLLGVLLATPMAWLSAVHRDAVRRLRQRHRRVYSRNEGVCGLHDEGGFAHTPAACLGTIPPQCRRPKAAAAATSAHLRAADRHVSPTRSKRISAKAESMASCKISQGGRDSTNMSDTRRQDDHFSSFEGCYRSGHPPGDIVRCRIVEWSEVAAVPVWYSSQMPHTHSFRSNT